MVVFSKFKMGSLEMPNRLVRSATGEGASEENTGRPTKAIIKHYRKLAEGGIGLIITGHVAVSYEGRCYSRMSSLHTDEFVADYRKIVEVCHEHQTPVVCQLNHGGRQVDPTAKGIRALCPSSVQSKGTSFLPEELTEKDILRIIDDFGMAAKRSKEAGFDGVQIHSAHGYLISQFNSPLTNRRDDAWGGTPEKRRRFLLDVYKAMRAKVGSNYPILVKQNVADYHPDGLTFEEALEICRELNKLGIDAIELSGGIAETIMTAFKAKEIMKKHELVFFEDEAKKVREEVNCPIILTGGIRTLETSERLISENVCDAVGFCRPFIREPDMAKKWHAQEANSAACVTCYRCSADPDECNFCARLKGK